MQFHKRPEAIRFIDSILYFDPNKIPYDYFRTNNNQCGRQSRIVNPPSAASGSGQQVVLSEDNFKYIKLDAALKPLDKRLSSTVLNKHSCSGAFNTSHYLANKKNEDCRMLEQTQTSNRWQIPQTETVPIDLLRIFRTGASEPEGNYI